MSAEAIIALVSLAVFVVIGAIGIYYRFGVQLAQVKKDILQLRNEYEEHKLNSCNELSKKADQTDYRNLKETVSQLRADNKDGVKELSDQIKELRKDISTIIVMIKNGNK